MGTITVLRPDKPGQPAPEARLAPRTPLGGGAVLTLIDNGKPQARRVLELIADELRASLPLARVDTYTKSSAGAPIDADTARMLAARSRLVVTGIGD
jgi:hypothetical protein